MAQIELRHATIRLKDGYTNTGAVNNVAGYSAGATTMIVDGITGQIPVLASFTITGSNRTHIVTAASGSPTTSITFTPALTGSVADNAVITFGGRTLEAKIGEGNLTYNEQREFEYTLDRGNLDTVRELDQQPLEVSLDFIWEFLTASSGGTPTIEDALKKRGEAASWVSSSADACEPYAVDIEVEYIPPCGGEQREIIVLADFRWESLDHNIQDASVAVSGRCNVTQATVARLAA